MTKIKFDQSNPKAQFFLLKCRYITSPLAGRVYGNFLPDAQRSKLVSKNTEVVIEGFPRSANSYAYNVFRTLNPEVTRIARHVHTPSQIVAAESLRKPTLLLIREPTESIVSLSKLYGKGAIDILLRSYVDYHEKLLAYIDYPVISDFSLTRRNFGEAIEDLNNKFRTEFRSEVNSHIDSTVKAELADFGAKGLGVAKLPPIRHDNDRDTTGLSERFVSTKLLCKAQDLYHSFREHARSSCR